MMRCAIWYHLYNLKNVKSSHRGVLLLVKLQATAATLLKVTLLHGCFHVLKIVQMVPSRPKASHAIRKENQLSGYDTSIQNLI